MLLSGVYIFIILAFFDNGREGVLVPARCRGKEEKRKRVFSALFSAEKKVKDESNFNCSFIYGGELLCVRISF